jgi:hypothetical protein
MSVHRSGNADVSYSDHDVHWIRHKNNFLAAADSGPDTTFESEEQFEVTRRGLDPDELAELRALVVDVSIGTGVSPIDQDEIGSFKADIECGFNLSGDEFLRSFGTLSNETVDVDASGTDDFRVGTRETDEVGQLFSAVLYAYPGYSDTNDGTGGSAGMPSLHETIDYTELTGGGPIVDAADDFTSRVSLDINNMVAGCEVDVTYGLYYAVEQSEGGRTRFGR